MKTSLESSVSSRKDTPLKQTFRGKEETNLMKQINWTIFFKIDLKNFEMFLRHIHDELPCHTNFKIIKNCQNHCGKKECRQFKFVRLWKTWDVSSDKLCMAAISKQPCSVEQFSQRSFRNKKLMWTLYLNPIRDDSVSHIPTASNRSFDILGKYYYSNIL